ncbi:MAG TPA: ABC transporter permease [Stellaceae bacterium]|nr:ABC transporter permease [Stellaceae bacterium]
MSVLSPEPIRAGDAGEPAPFAEPAALAEVWRMFRRNRAALAGLAVLLAIVLMTVIGPSVYRVDPFAIVGAPLLPPGSAGAPFGTDYLGRDLLAGIVNGGRASLVVGGSAAALTMLIGITIGALAGFYGGWIDQALMRVTEFFQVLPPLLMAMALVTLFSPSLATIAIAIGIVSWTAAARLTRGEFLRIRGLEYVLAARSIGARSRRLIWRVILPNALPPLIVSATLTVGIAILFESGLSFLGLGDPNVMSWGLMIGNNRAYMLDAWWTATIPGIAIFLTVLSISLIGDGLNEALSPRLRER